jgi:hypothetical protein
MGENSHAFDDPAADRTGVQAASGLQRPQLLFGYNQIPSKGNASVKTKVLRHYWQRFVKLKAHKARFPPFQTGPSATESKSESIRLPVLIPNGKEFRPLHPVPLWRGCSFSPILLPLS